MKLITTHHHAHFHAVESGAPAGWSLPLHALPSDWDSPDTLVLAFAAPGFETRPEPLEELGRAFPNSVIAGCSTAGEIAEGGVRDDSISVAVARFEHSRLRRACATVTRAGESFDAGARLATQLATDDAGAPLRAVFLLSDGLCVNGTPLVEGLRRGLPPDVVVTGGLAGDGSRFQRTWTLDARGRPESHRVCAVGFYGERLQAGHGCEGGWSDFGPERQITRSEGNVLYELDGRPALELYKTYLGERARGLPGTALLFPLAIRRQGQTGESLVRTILGIDEARQSLTFAGDMPEGGIARLMRANPDKLIASAGHAARAASAGVPQGRPALVVSVSCVGRRLVLGERTEEEVETVQDGAPRAGGHVGFYSYGEISPGLASGVSDLHNQTMTVTVFSES